jgi:hypothetical protein
VVLAAFTDQAYNLILLAEDEARMLFRDPPQGQRTPLDPSSRAPTWHRPFATVT